MPRTRSSLFVVTTAALLTGLIGCPAGPNPPNPHPPSSGPVVPEKELMVTDLSVVNSKFATAPDGPWTFGRLFRDLCSNDADAKALLLGWVSAWESERAFNGDTSAAREFVRDAIINSWKKRDGQSGVSDAAWNINWDHAPFRLLAIVNRIDLRRSPDDSQPSDAGEGRFIFCLHDNVRDIWLCGHDAKVDNGGKPLRFTVILEYGQQATTRDELLEWGNRWHALGALPFGKQYNAALRAITDRFAGRSVAGSKPNGSALNQIRTNEFVQQLPWELREFRLTGSPALLQQSVVKQTPRNALNGTTELADFINLHTAELTGPGLFIDPAGIGVNFLGAGSRVGSPPGASNSDFVWKAAGINDNNARHQLALNTCNGCHHRESGASEGLSPGGGTNASSGAGFVHVSPRARNQESRLSQFLRGVSIPDPVDGNTVRKFNDLEGRGQGLSSLLQLQGVRAFSVSLSPSQERRIVRVH